MSMPTSVKGQESNITNQLWLEFKPIKKITDRLTFDSKLGAKTIYPHSWYRYYISPRVLYLRPKRILKKWNYAEKVYGGINIGYNNNIGKVDIFEISPFQGYSLSIPNRARLVINHRLELKERFQFYTNDWFNTFGLQLTYEASFIFKFQGDLVEFGKGLFVPIKFKLYWNLIDAGFFNDVLKIRPGIGYSFNKQWKATFLVGYNYIRNIAAAEDFHTNNIIYQFSVNYVIPDKQHE